MGKGGGYARQRDQDEQRPEVGGRGKKWGSGHKGWGTVLNSLYLEVSVKLHLGF